MTAAEQQPGLVRGLGVPDAVVIGLGSMVGAGVFAVWGPAARAAGEGLLAGLVIAAIVAYCNAASSAQLAAVYPVSGGAYVYGRERLSPTLGFMAGSCFVIGKTASCAAMALTFATYVVPDAGWLRRGVALLAVVLLAAVNYRGVTRTARLTRILVVCSLTVLALVLVLLQTSNSTHRLPSVWPGGTSVYGVLQAAGLLFFAFAGYARIATMGEEVRDPARTIPRAVSIALLVAVGIYLLIGLALLSSVGAPGLAASSAPLATAVSTADAAWAIPVVRIGAALASLGALLALIAGIGRTTLAMARNGDLPGWLAAVHPRFRVPHHAEIALAVVVGVLVLTTDLRGVIGFSSFGVLLYYAIANAAAFTQPRDQRRWPRFVSVLGLLGCVVLAFTLPPASAVTAAAVLAVALLSRWLLVRSGRAGSARS
ncbi:amino acid/polyamine/organocation transporter (APC superfamily) [Kribbella voronezhensis]|uniref:Amino acid/polyamine/organocation transporter (APC superfamily) n=1 Tax=Kribbella voronezhensis TaxID=2512212 RepID=A0A4V3FKQ7_9ACTN|nr:APC family permease [Kribbella voronezhensis]TDU91143.1 amino acid/polyamine/organocation transporter (APC superfamily) [Kribbella voronezhensis]